MSFTKRILAAILVVIITVIPMIPVSSAVFADEDKIVVVLDAGHGGHDPGAAGIRSEAYYNLQVALAAKEKLEKNGNFIVKMTRSTADKYLTIAQRLYYADTVNADVVLSLHFNSGTSKSTNGVEVYGSVLDRFYLGTLAQKLSTKLASVSGLGNRGVFRKHDYGSTLYYWSEEYQWDIPDDKSVGGLSDYYGVITWGAKFGIPSLIIEHAYLSNPTDRVVIDNDDMLRKLGEADADALIEYYTNHTHSYGKEIIDAPVTCFSAGKKSVHCTVCGHRKNVTSVAASPDSTKHIWIEDEGSTSATCTTDGYAKYYCRYTHNLNDKGCTQFSVHRKEDVTPAYGHNYEVTFSREVTHTVDGIVTYACTRCSNSYSDITAAEGHTYVLSEHVDPVCDKNGYDKYTCEVCSESYSDVIPMLGHKFDISDHVDPTCEEDGSEHRKCTVCSFEEDAVIPKTGHNWVIHSDVLPNCTEEGIRETKCSVCEKMETVKTPKTGHSMEVVAEKAATCVEKGENLTCCIVCGFEETVITEPAGHDWESSEAAAPHCTEEIRIKAKCRTCGEDGFETIAPAGHVFEESVSEEPGLFLDGETLLKCSVCSHEETQPIRDLTIFEYIDTYPTRFWLMCGGAGVILLAAAAVVVIIIRKKKYTPAHAKPAEDKAEDTAESEEKETVE